MQDMTGTEYERWCASELAKRGFKNIRMTSASHDQGIDLIAESRGLTWGFQCKYYSSPVGNDAVQQAYAGKTYYGLDKAAVLSNQTFTLPAQTLAGETEVELWESFMPRESENASMILRIPAAVLLVCTLYSFFLTAAGPQLPQQELTVLAFALLSSLSVFLFADQSGALIFAAVCDLLFIVPALVMRVHLPLAAGFAFLLMLSLIRIVVFRKQKLMNDFRDEKEELRQLIRDTRGKYAEEIRTHLQEHLGKEVRLCRVDEKKDGTMVLFCTSAAKKEELALCEYTLNKEAEYEQAGLSFTLEPTGGRSFTARVRHRSGRDMS